jgi:hypothetical protein
VNCCKFERYEFPGRHYIGSTQDTVIKITMPYISQLNTTDGGFGGTREYGSGNIIFN